MNLLKSYINSVKPEILNLLSNSFDIDTKNDIIVARTDFITSDGHTIDLYIRENVDKYIITSDDDIEHWLFNCYMDYDIEQIHEDINKYIYFDFVINNNSILYIELDKNITEKDDGALIFANNIFWLAQTVQCVIWALYGQLNKH